MTSHALTRVGQKHPVYIAWVGMWTRCTNKKDAGWKNYGGRGIKVCERWEDPLCFIADMMPTWKRGMLLDRKDNDGNYTPDNCRWVDRKTQNSNRRNVKWVDTPDGRMHIKDAATKFGACTYSAIAYRIRGGMDPWKAITTPKRRNQFT